MGLHILKLLPCGQISPGIKAVILVCIPSIVSQRDMQEEGACTKLKEGDDYESKKVGWDEWVLDAHRPLACRDPAFPKDSGRIKLA